MFGFAQKYSRYSFLPQHLEIHWFSIINSCVTVLLLTGFLATILMRVLKNDFVKYTREDDMADEQARERAFLRPAPGCAHLLAGQLRLSHREP